LGDAIAALGIKYGSPASIEVTSEIYATLKIGCYESSVDMAQELGPFPIWDKHLESENPFLLRIREESPVLYERMQKYGRRNIALLTTPPAGTVSIEAQTSSSIEPVFMLSHIRRKKINPNDINARVDFVDPNGDCWQEFTVYHHHVKTWMGVTGETDISQSPWYGATANEIDWKERVKLQAAANRHVDHAISSTLNLPEDVSMEKVAEIYETAWEVGCKGITVYRDKCRTGVLIESKKPKILKTDANKRPKDLACEVYHPTCGGKRWFVIVGLFEGEPYEVFAGEYSIPVGVEKGLIHKVKRGQYSLLGVNGEVINPNIADYCSDDQEALLRMISTALRHGSDVRFVVEQLEKVRGPMYSFAKCLCRVLKKYIAEGIAVSGEDCPECSEAKLKREGGCIICSNCGWSKCI